MYQGYKIILTICARGGSKGISGKNTKLLLNKPLIAYTIEQAKQLKWVDKITVSTDCYQIKKIAETYGLIVPFLRPKYLSTDNAAKVPAIIHAINKSEKYWNEKYDINIDLDATSPLRTVKDIENCLKLLISKLKTKVVVSVYPANRNPYFNMVELNSQGYAKLSKKIKKKIIRRQDAPQVYSLNASIYTSWVKDLKKHKSYYTNNTRIYIMPEERSMDIDKPIDFEIVELLLKKQNE